jgi:hypothetical protein
VDDHFWIPERQRAVGILRVKGCYNDALLNGRGLISIDRFNIQTTLFG